VTRLQPKTPDRHFSTQLPISANAKTPENA
jgi:hypothetical protein